MAVASYSLVPVRPEQSPAQATGLWRFLFVTFSLFFGFFPSILAVSWKFTPCREGTPLYLYAPPLCMILLVTVGEVRILRRIHEGEGSIWELLSKGHEAIFSVGLWAGKLDHWFVLTVFGRLELFDVNTDALQPGQARACEAVSASPLAPIWGSDVKLSELFLVVAAVAFTVQGSLCFYHLWQARKLCSLESTVAAFTEDDAHSPVFEELRSAYESAATVADLMGAVVLGKVLAEAAGFLYIQQTNTEGFYNSFGDKTLQDVHEEGFASLEAAIQQAEAAAAGARQEGEHEVARAQEAAAEQIRAALEAQRVAAREAQQAMQQAVGTTSFAETKTQAISSQRQWERSLVVFKQCMVKVPCEAAPQLWLLSLMFVASFGELGWMGKGKVALSFALSLNTCLGKGRTLGMIGYGMMWNSGSSSGWLLGVAGVLSAVVVLCLSFVSVVKFGGAFLCKDTHAFSLRMMACVPE